MVFNASGRTITFPGFLKAYVETVDELAGGEADDAESRLPQLSRASGSTRKADRRRAHHQPARPLHRGVADQGAGRSGHRPAVDVFVDHQDHPGPRLCPQEGQRAGAVVGGVRRHRPARQHFGRLVDYGFTAAMEDELDEIAAGTSNAPPGSTTSTSAATTACGIDRPLGRLKKLVGVNLEGIDAREVNSIKLFDDEQGRAIVRVGKNGPYLGAHRRRRRRAEAAARQPQRLADPGRADARAGRSAFATPQEGRSLGVDPETGHEIVAKDGRYGPYVTEVLPEPEDGAPAKKARSPTVPSRAPARCCAR